MADKHFHAGAATDNIRRHDHFVGCVLDLNNVVHIAVVHQLVANFKEAEHGPREGQRGRANQVGGHGQSLLHNGGDVVQRSLHNIGLGTPVKAVRLSAVVGQLEERSLGEPSLDAHAHCLNL